MVGYAIARERNLQVKIIIPKVKIAKMINMTPNNFGLILLFLYFTKRIKKRTSKNIVIKIDKLIASPTPSKP